MQIQSRKQMVWGGLLIFFGVMLLVETYTTLTVWTWAILLAVGGLGVFGIYLTDRSDWSLLIPAYVMWAVAGLIALTELNILRDEAIAVYVLTSIGLPFLATFVRNRNQWWALIPAFVLLSIGGMVGLIGLNILRGEAIATYVLTAIALPFLVTFVLDRSRWWALVPAYSLLAIGGMIGLIGAGVLDDLLVPAYIMFAVAIPFFVVYARNTRLWWALIPGGITGIIGLAFLMADSAVQYIGPVALIVAGAWVLVRQFTRKEPTRTEADQPPAE